MITRCGGTVVTRCGDTTITRCGGTTVPHCGGTPFTHCGGTLIPRYGGTPFTRCGDTESTRCGGTLIPCYGGTTITGYGIVSYDRGTLTFSSDQLGSTVPITAIDHNTTTEFNLATVNGYHILLIDFNHQPSGVTVPVEVPPITLTPK
jgi:hypothetical protein